MMEKGKSDSNMHTIQYATRFMMDIGSRSKDKPLYDIWMKHLERMYSGNHQSCRWLLQKLTKERGRIIRILLSCPFMKVRDTFGRLFVYVMNCLANQEKKDYCSDYKCITDSKKKKKEKSDGEKKSKDEEEEEEEEEGEEENLERGVTIMFMETMFDLFPAVHRYMRNCREHFVVFRDFAGLNVEAKQYLLQRHTVKEMVEFYLQTGNYSSLASSTLSGGGGGAGRGMIEGGGTSGGGGGRGKETGKETDSNIPTGKQLVATRRTGLVKSPIITPIPATSIHATNFSGMIELLSLLVRSCGTESKTLPPTFIKRNKDDPNPTPAEVPTLPEVDKELVVGKSFIGRIIREQSQMLPVVEILKHWSWENKKKSKMFLVIVRDTIAKAKMESQLKPCFDVLRYLLALKDSLQGFRVHFSMVALMKIVDNHFTTKDSAKNCVKYITRLSEDNSEVRKWLNQNKSAWSEMLENHTPPSPNPIKKGIMDRIQVVTGGAGGQGH